MTDPDPRPSHAERARTLVAGRGVATLGTLAVEPAGHPYASLVAYAVDGATPVLLLSRLAVHTRHLEADPRASLLVAEDASDDPLSGGRVTLLGACRRLEDPGPARDAFLAAHPSAERYEGFADFGFFGLAVERARWVGGFGRMSWLDADAWAVAEPDPIAPHASGIVAHMNDDHADALLAYAHAFSGAADAEAATMTGIDRYGFEMRVSTPAGEGTERLAFDAPIASPTEAREALVALVKRARAALG
ncbi:MAG TPA: DUF2470 domain-containing protein [Sandaracinaceae bacterium LLY-WYZ-13_1]|nr:DUF2470 domain-containing protein [Sandaracinaceae bacterium LLY-WYZ-13_1]